MKIIDVKVERRENGGDPALVCIVTWEDKSQAMSTHRWHNRQGLWASPDESREPAEICATLRNFARAIEDAAKEKSAA